jgi:hypothetical protein
MAQRRWTPVEDIRIINYYHKVDINGLQQQLPGRSKKSISARINHLKSVGIIEGKQRYGGLANTAIMTNDVRQRLKNYDAVCKRDKLMYRSRLCFRQDLPGEAYFSVDNMYLKEI